MIYNWWCLSPPTPHIHLHIWCVSQIPRGSTTGECDHNVCFARENKCVSRIRGKYWGSVSGTLITIQSDTHSHSVPLLLLNRELSWGPWSFIPGKLDPGEGLAGTDVRLQEALEAPGVSMTLASVLLVRRLRHSKGQRRKSIKQEMSCMWWKFKCKAWSLIKNNPNSSLSKKTGLLLMKRFHTIYSVSLVSSHFVF